MKRTCPRSSTYQRGHRRDRGGGPIGRQLEGLVAAAVTARGPFPFLFVTKKYLDVILSKTAKCQQQKNCEMFLFYVLLMVKVNCLRGRPCIRPLAHNATNPHDFTNVTAASQAKEVCHPLICMWDLPIKLCRTDDMYNFFHSATCLHQIMLLMFHKQKH